MECYRQSLAVVWAEKEKPLTTTDQDLKLLIDDIKSSIQRLPVNIVTDDNLIVDHALKLSAVDIAQQLLKKQALTLLSAHAVNLYYEFSQLWIRNSVWYTCSVLV